MLINEFYDEYKKGKITNNLLKEKVLIYVYEKVSKDRYIESGDFLIEFIPKLDNIISEYKSDLCHFP